MLFGFKFHPDQFFGLGTLFSLGYIFQNEKNNSENLAHTNLSALYNSKKSLLERPIGLVVIVRDIP